MFYLFDPEEMAVFPRCPFLLATGYECPGCGSQRAIHDMLHLDLKSAFSQNALIERGHTDIIIEHNMEVIKCADHIIDIGPEGGISGGYIVCEGTPETISACKESHTGRFLREKLT